MAAPTQADVDARIQAFIATRGIRALSFENQSATFNSVDEELRAIAYLQRQVDAASTTPKGHRFAVTSKGA